MLSLVVRSRMSAIIPNITKLTSRVTRILGCNPGPMTLQGTNTYLIGTGNRRILLDTGDAHIPQYINNLKAVLNKNKILLEHIIVTHWHHDHVGGVRDVIETVSPGCKVWKYKRSDVEEDQKQYNCVKLYELSDGQTFTIEGATLNVIHTPGHATDHVVLQLKEENAVFSGDCILGEGTAVFEDLYTYINSLKIIQSLQPSVIYPGHGPIITDPIEKITFYIQHRTQRENEIIKLLHISNESITSLDIVKSLYKNTPESLHQAAKYVVELHLKKLLKENRVIKEDNDKWKIFLKNNM
ncbi:endoribonuclease LACTB2 [Lycorma delicatula]|uniref:endoribonuclease LACTB2 n=1 Tax=Lycorma delicatula TaxID=130591 RepID=UPI003F51A8A0